MNHAMYTENLGISKKYPKVEIYKCLERESNSQSAESSFVQTPSRVS